MRITNYSWHVWSSYLRHGNTQQKCLCPNSFCKVGRSKSPLVLTGGFNRLKLHWSICQKVVNTGQYESKWWIENFKWWTEILGQGLCWHLLKFKSCWQFPLEDGCSLVSVFNQFRTLFTLRFQCQDLSTDFCISVQAPYYHLSFVHQEQNAITIQGLFASYRNKAEITKWPHFHTSILTQMPPGLVNRGATLYRYTGKPWFTLNKYHIAIHFWLYRYRSLFYVSSSQFSSKICKKISIIGFEIAQKSGCFQNRKRLKE